MCTILRTSLRRLSRLSLPVAAGLLLFGASSAGDSFPAGAQRSQVVVPVQAGAPAASPADKKPLDEETKRKARSAVLLLSIVAGIALSGLLIIIVAITVRGLRRKLAGPTRLDQEPQDILPEVASPPPPEAPAAGEPSGAGGAAEQETHFT